MDFEGNPTPFFLAGFPLKIHPRPQVSGMDFEGDPTPFFFYFFGLGSPLISIPDLKGLVIEFGGTPTHFFINDFNE